MSGGIYYVLECVAVPVVSVICGFILWKATTFNAFWGISVKAFIAERVIVGLCAENVGAFFGGGLLSVGVEHREKEP